MASSTKKIPRILHQTWKEKSVPPAWRFAVDSWREHHSDWEFRWWTDADNDAFVQEVFPEFLPTWERYPYAIQRADAVRYLLLYHLGGVYADLDLESLRPVEPLLAPGTFIAGREPERHIRDSGQPLLCNAFMAAPPGHPFLRHIIDQLKAEDPCVPVLGDILESTGPAFLHRMLESYDGDDVRVLPSGILYPIDGRHPLAGSHAGPHPRRPSLVETCRKKGAYTVHYWSNSWVRNQHGVLENPAPHDIPGFIFYPGLESPDGDGENLGRNIPEVAAACLKDPHIPGFNTAGFPKHSLCPRWQWIRLPYPEPGEGLYVKPEHCPKWTPVGVLLWGFRKAAGVLRNRLRLWTSL